MRKIMNWVLAATFICGASVFTSCSANDANDKGVYPAHPPEPEGDC